jgi:hypothetical protein
MKSSHLSSLKMIPGILAQNPTKPDPKVPTIHLLSRLEISLYRGFVSILFHILCIKTSVYHMIKVFLDFKQKLNISQ